MAKFKHQDEEESYFFCEMCDYEHSSDIPEHVCVSSRERRNKEAVQKNRLLRGKADSTDEDEDEKDIR